MEQDSFELGPEYFHITLGLAVLALFSGALRLASRWLTKARFGVDDAWMVVSMVLMLALVVDAGYVFLASGNGRHFSLRSEEQREIFKKAFFASQMLYFLIMTSIKFSVLCLYRAIFPSRGFRAATVVLGAACVLWWMGGTLAMALQCRPLRAAWDASVANPRCVDGIALFDWILSFNVVLDMAIILLPIYPVWRLNLPKNQRLTVLFIFGLGLGAPIICILRLTAFIGVSRTSDQSFEYLQCSLWTLIEPIIALTCANLPTLRPLLPHSSLLFSRLSHSRSSTRRSSPLFPSSPHIPNGKRHRKSWYGSGATPSSSGIKDHFFGDSKDSGAGLKSSDTGVSRSSVEGFTRVGVDGHFYHELQEQAGRSSLERGGCMAQVGVREEEERSDYEPGDRGIYVRNEVRIDEEEL